MNSRESRLKRQNRIRHKIKATATRARLHVYRSNRYTYAQIIDGQTGNVQAAASQKELGKEIGTKTQQATAIGKLVAQKAIKLGIKKIVFDRNFYKYHGRIKALAEAARKEGLEF